MMIREQNNLRLAEYIIGRTYWDLRITSILAPRSIYYHCDEILRNSFYTHNWKYIEKGKLIIHTTTGNMPYKGFETICETLFELNRLTVINIEWQIAGISDGDNIIKVTKNKLRKKFPGTGLLYLGLLDENELIDMLCNAHIYVSPSHIENSSNSLCEAMMVGMPCIATFAGGTGSILKDGEEGILVQDGDPWALAGAILELYRNKTLARQYGEKARQRSVIRHDTDKIIKEMLGIYNQIVIHHQQKQITSGNF